MMDERGSAAVRECWFTLSAAAAHDEADSVVPIVDLVAELAAHVVAAGMSLCPPQFDPEDMIEQFEKNVRLKIANLLAARPR